MLLIYTTCALIGAFTYKFISKTFFGNNNSNEGNTKILPSKVAKVPEELTSIFEIEFNDSYHNCYLINGDLEVLIESYDDYEHAKDWVELTFTNLPKKYKRNLNYKRNLYFNGQFLGCFPKDLRTKDGYKYILTLNYDNFKINKNG